jgi:penicillin-binding protein 2
MISFRKQNANRDVRRKSRFEIDPDEVLIDASNLPEFDTERFEGRIEQPISKFRILTVLGVFILVIAIFSGKLWILQVRDSAAYAEKSENNRLHHSVVFAERGLIVDRNGTLLSWNEPRLDDPIPKRAYKKEAGFSHVLGYVSYPKKDTSGFYYQEVFEGKDGIESIFNEQLTGKNGIRITETNAKGVIESESTIAVPKNGDKVTLSIDAKVQEIMQREITKLSEKANFTGGAGVMMDVDTGEMIALTSFPEFDEEKVSLGDASLIDKLSKDSRNPFLNRAVAGVYTPGSIVKLFVALGALSENIVDPNKEFYSSGKIEVPNPYNKEEKSVFVDWKAHGFVDMRKALAVSSNVYFYIIGGGFEGQKGLGIANIEKYMRMFGFGNLTGIEFGSEQEGTIPNPSWKEEHFNGDEWRLGDTYHTSIGQYGVQVTPLQVVRAVAAIANNGKLLNPLLSLVKDDHSAFDDSPVRFQQLPISPQYFQVVREGMRQAVLIGTARALNTKDVVIAAKTGTAEIGISKKFVNSWAIGFFPYEKPKYAFALLMEHGPRTNTIGAAAAMRGVIDGMLVETPEYFGKEKVEKVEADIAATSTDNLPEIEVTHQ